MNADEIMTDEVVTIDDDATVGEAIEVMSTRGVRHLPVLRGGEVVGMLSDRDVRRFGASLVADLDTIERGKARVDEVVTKVMSANVVTVQPATDVAELVDLLLEERVGAVPVVDEETSELVGIVSTLDVLRAVRPLLAEA
jgi:acetoin utilization protein AcuB